MNTQDLKEYLGMVVDMEANCHLLETLRQKLSWKLASIKDPQPKVIALPSRPNQPIKPEMPEKPELPESELKRNNVLTPILCGCLGAIGVAMFLPLMYAMVVIPLAWLFDVLVIAGRRTHATSDCIAYFIELAEYWFKFALKYTVAPGTLLGVFVSINTSWKNAKANDEVRREYNEKLDKYNRKYSEQSKSYSQSMHKFRMDMREYYAATKQYHTSLKQDSKRIQTEAANNEKKRSFLTATLADLEKRTEEAQRCLQDLYSRDIIFPKYRNFVMVCSLYEYICAGRCSTLDGRDGAYNILEVEMRVDRIITQLDYAIAQLNEIRANQYELFTVLQSNQQILTDIERSNQKILQELIEGKRERDNMQADKLSSYYEELEQKERDYENRKDHFQ